MLTEQKIRELVKLRFGETCEVSAIKELKGGMFNSIYLIERTNERDKIVLKVGVVPGTPLLTYEQDVMPTEVECFRLVQYRSRPPFRFPECLHTISARRRSIAITFS